MSKFAEEHTPEPWAVIETEHKKISYIEVLANGYSPICRVFRKGKSGIKYTLPQKANAERIVACVNACAGIKNPDVVPKIIEVAKQLVADYNFQPRIRRSRAMTKIDTMLTSCCPKQKENDV